ncbi:GFA family protein [Rhizobium cauense]|uniref:GFA family protein n=1 Tax=Rhizobium cauense TaxID=1166683 RepID=UPI001C6E3564|nr:GFA family protein [Rhizobium cauense]MBW9114802.1 GFA family protein [Rhizobium cauense]
MTTLTGSCRCGQVRVAVRGDPVRVGICHCTDCRQESGSAFTFFAVWPTSEFQSKGEPSEYAGRQFCPKCGSRLFSLSGEEVEIKLGILTDAPTPLKPTYELWIKRRETWLTPVEGAEQFDEDRL